MVTLSRAQINNCAVLEENEELRAQLQNKMESETATEETKKETQEALDRHDAGLHFRYFCAGTSVTSETTES